MPTSFHIVLRDLDTGAARTGLTVKLFNHLDNFTTEVLTATEVPGYGGVYEFTYTDFNIAKYRLKANGSWDGSFSDENGTWLYDGSKMMIVNGSGRWDFGSKRAINVANPVDDGDAVNKGWSLGQFYTKTEINSALALKVAKAGTETITGLKQFEILPRVVPTDSNPGVYPTPSNLGDVIYKKYFDYVLSQVHINPYPQFAGVLRVIPGVTAQPGRAYPTILEAVTYSLAQTPSATKQYAILIEGITQGQEFLTAASGSLQSYIHLIGIGKFVKVIIEDDSLLANTSLNNLSLYFGAGVITSARIFNSVDFIDCCLYNFKDITVKNGSLVNSRCISDSGYNMLVEDACNVEHTIFNRTPEKVNHTGAYFADEFSDYLIPTDPTLPA